MSVKRGQELEDRMLGFAVRVGRAADAIPDSRLGRHVAGQLVRSGTSPAANYAEADAAESKKDFVHKLGIVLKELRETRVWLRFLLKAELLLESKLTDLVNECEQLCKIIAKSRLTATTNLQTRAPRD